LTERPIIRQTPAYSGYPLVVIKLAAIDFAALGLAMACVALPAESGSAAHD
jgi:hypothetical protein